LSPGFLELPVAEEMIAAQAKQVAKPQLKWTPESRQISSEFKL